MRVILHAQPQPHARTHSLLLPTPAILCIAGIARELALTARTFDAAEAHSMHLVTSVHTDRDALLCAARETAAAIACKSPLAIAGVKRVMVYQRDHSVQVCVCVRVCVHAVFFLGARG
jgi:hypothetical protein